MTYVKGEASVVVTVNVPAHKAGVYEAHARRIVKLLNQGGYEAYPMTGQYILRMAADIEREMAAAAEAKQLMDELIANRKDA